MNAPAEDGGVRWDFAESLELWRVIERRIDDGEGEASMLASLAARTLPNDIGDDWRAAASRGARTAPGSERHGARPAHRGPGALGESRWHSPESKPPCCTSRAGSSD